MAANAQLAPLFLFFLGMALCLWRLPQSDRLHPILCGVAAALWCAVLLIEPRARTPIYGFTVLMFLRGALSRPFQRRVL